MMRESENSKTQPFRDITTRMQERAEKARNQVLIVLKNNFPKIFESGLSTVSAVLSDPETNIYATAPEKWSYGDELVFTGDTDLTKTAGVGNFHFRHSNFDDRKDSPWVTLLEMQEAGNFGRDINVKWEGYQDRKNTVEISFGKTTFHFDPVQSDLRITDNRGVCSFPLLQGFMHERINEAENTLGGPILLENAATVGNLLVLSFKDRTVLNGGVLIVPVSIDPRPFD